MDIAEYADALVSGEPSLRKSLLVEASNKYGVAGIVSAVASKYWINSVEAVRALGPIAGLAQPKRTVHTVALYYSGLSIGGAERVTAFLANLWAGMGYRVVLITDDDTSAYEYEVNQIVERRIIPSYCKANAENYENRAKALADILNAEQVDALVYGQWLGQTLPWDMLLCKMSGVSFLIYTHGVMRCMFDADRMRAELALTYRYSDGVITLSDVNTRFWQLFNAHVWQTINPLTIEPDSSKRAALDSYNIVWVGRLSLFDKRPDEALRVMAEVVKQCPDAHLIMVGPFADDATEQQLRQLRDSLDLSDAVSFVGAQDNVLPYLQKASVYLHTSLYEGYPIALAEAKTVGIPSVIYALPYLTLVQDESVIQVGQGNRSAAASAICGLWQNPEKMKQLGDIAFNSMVGMSNYDFARLWRGIFDSLGSSTASSADDDVMVDLMIDARIASSKSYEERINSLCSNQTLLEQSLSSKSMEIQSVKESTSFKVGLLITAIPRKIKAFLNSLRR